MPTTVSEGLPTRARLYNDGKKEYSQVVNGDRYIIKPGEYIELPRRVAVAVRGFFAGKNVESRLRMELVGARELENIETPEPERIYMCHKCDEEFTSKEDYQKHYDDKHKRVRGVPAERQVKQDDPE